MKKRIALYDCCLHIDGQMPDPIKEKHEELKRKIESDNNAEFVDSFIDDCRVSVHPLDRKDFIRLYEKCSKGEVDEIAIPTLVRISRSPEILLDICRKLNDMGIKTVFEHEGITGENLMESEPIKAISNALAKIESGIELEL